MIRDVHEIDARHEPEQFARDMLRAANAGGCHVDLARIGFGVGDELRHGLGRKVRQHFHDQRDTEDSGNRSDVVHEIEWQFGKERSVDRVLRIDQ